MTNKGVTIKYGDIAPEAKENFSPTSSESMFDTVSQLKQYNLNFPNYANPMELYQTVLDGNGIPFPSDSANLNLGLWSEQISGENGDFEYPIVLTLDAEKNYSSQGFTLTFDNSNNIYSNHLNIKWYRAEELISEKDFYPDSAFYFCRNKVDLYDKVVITFYSMNLPHNRLKLRSVDYGYGTIFLGNELRNVRLIQEVDPISSQISINTADFVLDSKRDIEYSFQARQPLSIYFNGKLKATVFVKSAKRTAKRIWRIESEDYIGLLDSVYFEGGVYSDKNAVELIGEIFDKAKIPFYIDPVFVIQTVSGYIPYCTCRQALMQVALAIQAVVDTSNSDVVNIYDLDDNITQTIPLNRIRRGQNFDDEDTVTAVEVTAHTYSPIEETAEVYKADDSGTGEQIMVTFSEPLHSLSILNGVNGELLKGGSTFALINASDGCVLVGKKYRHTTQTKRINNPLVSAGDTEKILSISNATLVSRKNIDNVLEKCYNYLVRTNTVNLSIIEGKHVSYSGSAIYGTVKYGEAKYGETGLHSVEYDKPVNVGEMIKAETEYLGNVSGRIIKQTFNLNGGIIVKEAVLR